MYTRPCGGIRLHLQSGGHCGVQALGVLLFHPESYLRVVQLSQVPVQGQELSSLLLQVGVRLVGQALQLVGEICPALALALLADLQLGLIAVFLGCRRKSLLQGTLRFLEVVLVLLRQTLESRLSTSNQPDFSHLSWSTSLQPLTVATLPKWMIHSSHRVSPAPSKVCQEVLVASPFSLVQILPTTPNVVVVGNRLR